MGKVTTQQKESTYSLSRGCLRGEIVEDDGDETRTTVKPQIHTAAK
jgi:hypothetical protein